LKHQETFLVTGASRGIGLELVRQLLEAGDRVIAACRQPAATVAFDPLQKKHAARLTVAALDVADPRSIEALARQLHGTAIDVLVNNAGIFGRPDTPGWPEGAAAQSLAGMDYEHWEQVQRTNVIGPFRLTAALLPNLLAGQRKLVVMMSSDLGSIALNTQGTSHAYRSSKAALNMLTRGLAADLREQGVTVISLAPGWTQTELGGRGAEWTAEASVASQRRVISRVGLQDSGTFINVTGEVLPW
jgi:NAD(P)-dependent dehydrogenase (short-subunit alcohol dehydrogenase family)